MMTWHDAHRLVGVVHLPPLPGSARGEAATVFPALLDRAVRDALTWAEGGADALIVENFGDVPFQARRVEPHTIAAMSLAVGRIAAETGVPIGVNVLRNDVPAAVSIAALAGGAFVRANVYVGAALTDQGIIEGEAAEVQALIRRLDAPVAVWADLDVKHAAQLAPRPIAELAEDAVERGLAAAVIVTGAGTGKPVAEEDLAAVRNALPDTPVYAGSGVTMETIPAIFRHANGAIIGTAAKRDGDIAQPVDPDRVRALRAAIDAVR
jgi:membrane complex biogenesis BtpA family protein